VDRGAQTQTLQWTKHCPNNNDVEGMFVRSVRFLADHRGLRLAGARSSPDRVEIAYKMLGDDPDAGHNKGTQYS
jgi:hypothetical protein